MSRSRFAESHRPTRLLLTVSVALAAMLAPNETSAVTPNRALERAVRERPEARAFERELARLDALRRLPTPPITDSAEVSFEWAERCRAERVVAGALEARIDACTECSERERAIGWALAVVIREAASGSCAFRAVRPVDPEPHVVEWLGVLARERFVETTMSDAMISVAARCVESTSRFPDLEGLTGECRARADFYRGQTSRALAQVARSGPTFDGEACEWHDTSDTYSVAAASRVPGIERAFFDPDALRGEPWTTEERRQLLAAMQERFAALGSPTLASARETSRWLARLRGNRAAYVSMCGAPTSEPVMLARLGVPARPVRIDAFEDEGEVSLSLIAHTDAATTFRLESTVQGRLSEFDVALSAVRQLALPVPRSGSFLVGSGAGGDGGSASFPRAPYVTIESRPSGDFDDEAVASVLADRRDALSGCPHSTGSDAWTVTVAYSADGSAHFVEAIRASTNAPDACVESLLRSTHADPSLQPRRWLLARIHWGIGYESSFGLRADDPWRSYARVDAAGSLYPGTVRVLLRHEDSAHAFVELEDSRRAAMTLESLLARCYVRARPGSHQRADVSISVEVDESGQVVSSESTSSSSEFDACIREEARSLGLPCRLAGSPSVVHMRACVVGEYDFPARYFTD